MAQGDKAHELLTLLNPIHRSSNSAALHRDKVEPYAICAHIYAVPPPVGRGGWTWYTGSAGSMFRVGVEGWLGLKTEGDVLVFDPCIGRAWPGDWASYRHDHSVYEVVVANRHGAGRAVTRVECDGKTMDGPPRVKWTDDGTAHQVRVFLG
jgi:cyclic beta-1,2-glucan synthetase